LTDLKLQIASGVIKRLYVTSFQKLDIIAIQTVVPFSVILDSSRRDNSEFVASFTISSRPFLGEVYRYRRENGIACVACRAAKRPGRPAMKRDFVAPTHSASPLDEILTKNTYRVSYRVLVRIMIRGETYSKNKLYKYPVSQILRSEFRA